MGMHDADFSRMDLLVFCVAGIWSAHIAQGVLQVTLCDDDDGLQDCALKINAPNLVSFTYHGWVAKEYFLSSFQTLESASVWICVPRGRKIGAATIFVAHEFVNIVPIFHNLEKLLLELEVTIDKSVFPLLKAAPNLTHLEFNENIHDKVEDEDWDGLMLTTRCLFEHLQSACFMFFNGNAREMRWLKLILRNAKVLHTVTVGSYVNPIMRKTNKYLCQSSQVFLKPPADYAQFSM
ncbi:hypothetical protein C5167_005978 [Papaver somniferum]|uniref:FBD domain-containing protein n=1 Tax=Papaver somniferum TaxID=3469 RepID=A0A4Y7JC08_PAPSO|nr:hypothetical protein C5167_005978 [Papaver somniferum]